MNRLLRIFILFLLKALCIKATEEQICNHNECYPRIFVPKEEFQVVREGQEIPKGLHVRINMQTGEKEAKLYDPAQDTSDSESIVLHTDALQVVESGVSRKRAMETFTMSSRTQKDTSSHPDSEIFADAISALDTSGDSESLTLVINNLEALAHDRDFGIKLVQSEKLTRLLSLARTHELDDIRQSAARIIGSSMWNNPDALDVVSGTKLVTKLVDLLQKETSSGVRASLIFALSAAVAGDYGVPEFVYAGGSVLLRHLFEEEGSEVQRKCATFVEDNLPYSHGINGVDEELSEWCHLFQRFLQKNTPDETSEKVLSSLMYNLAQRGANDRAIKREATKTCPTESEFIPWLADNVAKDTHARHMAELLKEARHMFGNPKAARKTAWEEEHPHQRDEL